MLTLDNLLASLELEPTGTDRYRAANADTGHAVVFGGQLLGQSIIAALAGNEDKRVKTIHTVFARGGSPDSPVEIAVDRMQSGRTFASSTVTVSQGDRLCTRSLVLLSADEPDLIRHADAAPDVGDPDDATPVDHGTDAWNIRFPGNVDIDDPEVVGPPELNAWVRFPGAPEDPAIEQALLAFATDGFLIATAMRPHHGVGQSLAHVTLSTGVITHTLTFHEPCPVGDWVLLAHHSGYAGHGRSYGSANVFRRDGTLTASFVQDAMIRPIDTSRTGVRL